MNHSDNHHELLWGRSIEGCEQLPPNLCVLRINHRCMATVFLLFMFLVLTNLPQSAYANAVTWLSASGTDSWNSSVNWSGSTVPTSTDYSIVDSGFTVNAPSGVSGFAYSLSLGQNSTGTLKISGGTINDGLGILGNTPGSSGTATITSGTWTNSNLVVGGLGAGILNVNGGVVNASSGSIGYAAGASGSTTVSSGTLTTGNFLVGYSGTGTLTLGNGTYSGNLILAQNPGSKGTLNIGTGVVYSGAQFGSAISGGDGTAIVNFNHSNTIGFNFPLIGTLSVNKLGAGTTIFISTLNSYTGTTTITTGTLQIGMIGVLPGTLGNGSVVNNATLAFNNYAPPGLVANPISGSGSLVLNGTTSLTLTGSNNYTGGTTIGRGTLRVGNVNALGIGSNSLSVNVGVLDLSGYSVTVGTLSGSNSTMITSNNGPATLTVNQGAKAIYAGAIQNGSGIVAMNKSGAATLILSGSNSYTGGTTISSGTLWVLNANALGADSSSLAINVGTLDLSGYSVTVGTLSGSNGALITSSSTAVAVTFMANQSISGTYAGMIQNGSGILAMAKSGTGTLSLTASNGYTGGTTIKAGTLDLGPRAIIKHASAPMTVGDLGADNGLLSISGGTVISAGGVLGNQPGSVGAATISDGNWNNSTSLLVGGSGSGILNVNGGVVSASSVSIGYAAGASGTVTVTSGTLAANGPFYIGYSGSGSGTLNVDGGVITSSTSFIGFGSFGAATVNSGNWSTSGTLFIGQGILNINGGFVSDFSCRLMGSATIASGTWNSGDMFIGGGGTLNLIGSSVVMIGNGGGTLVLGEFNTSGTLNVGMGNTAGMLYTGAVSGSSGNVVNFNHTGSYFCPFQLNGFLTVNKLGTGTTKLSSMNNFVGITTIYQGTLEVNGSFCSNGEVDVVGGTLSGSGAVGGRTNVVHGGILSPGSNGMGVLAFTGPLSLNASTLNIQLGNVTTSSKITASGIFSATGLTTINITGTTGFGAGNYGLIYGAPGISATNFVLGTNPNGHKYALIASDSTLFLIVDGTASEIWKVAHFGTNADSPAVGGDTVVNNNAGIANMVAYALGLDPFNATLGGLPVSSIKSYSDTNYLSFIFNRNSAATDITYVVEASSNLSDPEGWTPIASSVNGAITSGSGFVSETGSGEILSVEVQDILPVSSENSRFMRLRITH